MIAINPNPHRPPHPPLSFQHPLNQVATGHGILVTVIRTLDEAMEKRIHGTAAHYVRNWRRFAEGLRRID